MVLCETGCNNEDFCSENLMRMKFELAKARPTPYNRHMELILLKLIALIMSFSYVGLFFFVTLFSFLAVSEEVVLFATGILLSQGYLSLVPGILVAYLGILMGDAFCYLLGWLVNHSVKRLDFLKKFIKPNDLRYGERWFNKYGQMSVPIARFIIGVRFQTFVFAGVMGMRFKKFLMYDALANLIFTPTVILMGYYFGDSIVDKVMKYFGGSSKVLAIIIFILFFGFFVFQIWFTKHKEHKKRRERIRIRREESNQ